jgi:hypothetical protein
MAGLVPAIPIHLAPPYRTDRDRRDTPGDDAWGLVPAPRFSRAGRQIRLFPMRPQRMRGLSLCFPSPPTQRKAERRQTREQPSAPAGCGAAPARWAGRSGSPVGVPPRFSPRGLTSTQGATQAMLPGTRSGRCYRPSPVPVQRAPRAPVIVPADMMPKPPGNGPYPPARGHRTRSRLPEYLRERRPVVSEPKLGK